MGDRARLRGASIAALRHRAHALKTRAQLSRSFLPECKIGLDSGVVTRQLESRLENSGAPGLFSGRRIVFAFSRAHRFMHRRLPESGGKVLCGAL